MAGQPRNPFIDKLRMINEKREAVIGRRKRRKQIQDELAKSTCDEEFTANAMLLYQNLGTRTKQAARPRPNNVDIVVHENPNRQNQSPTNSSAILSNLSDSDDLDQAVSVELDNSDPSTATQFDRNRTASPSTNVNKVSWLRLHRNNIRFIVYQSWKNVGPWQTVTSRSHLISMTKIFPCMWRKV